MDAETLLRNYGVAIFLVLWGTWMLTFRVWPWFVDKDKVRLGFEGKRLEMEAQQANVMVEIAKTLGELKQLVSQDRDAALAALNSINEHRKETVTAVTGISELRVEVAKLGRAKAMGGEPPRKGSVKAPPAPMAAGGSKNSTKKKAADPAGKN